MIENEILYTINRFNLLKKNCNVTVALSGGADSVCLTYALNQLKEKLNIKLSAAHLNHLIRGEEADRDEEFVKELCENLGIPLTVERFDVPKFAKKNSKGIETAAREVRYSFFNSLDTDYIATAHTANDNLETVLLNLTRGTALDGLAGIPPKRNNIIRPLLFCTREMVEGYCKNNNLAFITDSSNLTDDYSRNKLRHNVVPVLKEINPNIEDTVLRNCINIREMSQDYSHRARAYIDENLNNHSLNLYNFKKLSKALAKRVIIEFVAVVDSSIRLEACHIEEVYNICLNGGKTGIPNNKHCYNNKGILTIIDNKVFEEKIHNPYEIILNQLNFSKSSEKINNLLLNNALDCDKIIGKLVIRTRLPGDKIRLLNRGCTKTLNKLYNESSIPDYLRNSLPVIADDEGVVWIYNIGVAKRCAVTNNTKKIFKIEVCERKDV